MDVELIEVNSDKFHCQEYCTKVKSRSNRELQNLEGEEHEKSRTSVKNCLWPGVKT